MSKVVLITGATSDIGTSCAKKFSSLGYDLILHYHKNETVAKKLEKELKNVTLIKADFESEEDIKNMAFFIKDKFDKIDVLINNAAYCFDSLYQDKTKKQFIKTFDINVVAPHLLIKELESELIKGKGSIINIASTNGIDTNFPMCLDYDASKSALISLTHNLALQFAPYVRVNAVAPGFIGTKSELKDMDLEFIKQEEEKILLQRMGRCEEVANVISFLASEDASYINNEVIRVDGGFY